MSKPENPGSLVLSLNRALWDEITPNTRAALISQHGSELRVRFVFYTSPSEDEIEGMGYITTEVIAAFSAPLTISESYEISESGHIDIADGELLVYRRKD